MISRDQHFNNKCNIFVLKFSPVLHYTTRLSEIEGREMKTLYADQNHVLKEVFIERLFFELSQLNLDQDIRDKLHELVDDCLRMLPRFVRSLPPNVRKAANTIIVRALPHVSDNTLKEQQHTTLAICRYHKVNGSYECWLLATYHVYTTSDLYTGQYKEWPPPPPKKKNQKGWSSNIPFAKQLSDLSQQINSQVKSRYDTISPNRGPTQYDSLEFGPVSNSLSEYDVADKVHPRA